MFSQTAEYALRVVVYLASLNDRAATLAQIAEATRIPAGYLAKVCAELSRQQIIKTQRGLHGGSILARSAATISVYDVIQSVDPIRRIESCPLGLMNHGVNLCPLHKRLDDAIASVVQAFQASTIAELVADPSTSKPLGDIPTIPASGLVSMKILRKPQ